MLLEPEKEEELIIREAERFVRKGRPTISQREAEQIADQFATRGISKLRVLAPDDKKTYIETEVNLTEVQVQVGDDHTNKIELTDDMGMIMTYPTIDSFNDTGIQNVNASNMLDVIASCVLQIYEKNGEKVYQAKDQTKKELIEFIEQLNTKQFKKLQKFFDTMPRLKHTIKVKNPKTKKSSDITLSGLNDFFG